MDLGLWVMLAATSIGYASPNGRPMVAPAPMQGVVWLGSRLFVNRKHFSS